MEAVHRDLGHYGKGTTIHTVKQCYDVQEGLSMEEAAEVIHVCRVSFTSEQRKIRLRDCTFTERRSHSSYGKSTS